MIVLIDQVSNLDEHFYLLLGNQDWKLEQERSRLPIHKTLPNEHKMYIRLQKRNEYPCNMSRRVGRNLYETVCRQMQTN